MTRLQQITLLIKLKTDIIKILLNVSIIQSTEEEKIKQSQNQKINDIAKNKIGRNEPCPCNSGKKYKHCHGAF